MLALVKIVKQGGETSPGGGGRKKNFRKTAPSLGRDFGKRGKEIKRSEGHLLP